MKEQSLFPEFDAFCEQLERDFQKAADSLWILPPDSQRSKDEAESGCPDEAPTSIGGFS